jgi:hypothetical protein
VVTDPESVPPDTRGERIRNAMAQFERAIDLVEAGGDPTGRRSIAGPLETHAADETVIVLPPGRYLLDREFALEGFDRFGLLGHDAVVTAPPREQFPGDACRLFRFGTPAAPGGTLLLDGIGFETPEAAGGNLIEAHVDERLDVRDLGSTAVSVAATPSD